MKGCQGVGQTLVVSGHPAKASGPSEGPFHDPAAGQEHEFALGFGQLDDLQPDAMGLRRVRSGCSGVALIDIGHFDLVAREVLNRLGQRFVLGPILWASAGVM